MFALIVRCGPQDCIQASRWRRRVLRRNTEDVFRETPSPGVARQAHGKSPDLDTVLLMLERVEVGNLTCGQT